MLTKLNKWHTVYFYVDTLKKESMKSVWYDNGEKYFERQIKYKVEI